MAEVAGTVQARTTNGGVGVRLSGERWTGSGLELETTNGSIELSVPTAFSADLSARTVNGSIRADFPVSVRGASAAAWRRASAAAAHPYV